MQIGNEQIIVGDCRRIVARYASSLRPGEHLVTYSVTTNSPVSTISQTAISPDKLDLFFWVQAGSQVETFTCFLSVVTSDGQIFNDTVVIGVALPASYATLTPVQPFFMQGSSTGPTGPTGPGLSLIHI